MATAAFRSSSRRSSGIGAADPSATPRRARSLSRYSGRCPPPEQTRGRFVNTERGARFPEVSLDELANEFALERGWELEERGRGRRSSDAGFTMGTESSRRRGRSVSRKGTTEEGRKGADGEGSARRRRSLSVARYHRPDDFEGEVDLRHSPNSQNKFGNASGTNGRPTPLFKSNASAPSLRRSSSKQDLQLSHDSCSSQSSSLTDDESNGIYGNGSGSGRKTRAAYLQKKSQSSSLTDDEGRVIYSSGSGSGRKTRTVYLQKKNELPSLDRNKSGLYDINSKEVRKELDTAMKSRKPVNSIDSDNFQTERSDAVKAIAEIRKNYTLKLEESEKRKQELLAELAAEEHRGRELSKIVNELLPETNRHVKQERPSRGRRSSEKTKISRRLNEEAEKYFEELILNIEDTDISSYDGERSDTSSTLGGGLKLIETPMSTALVGAHEHPAKAASSHAENDGILLPWLHWGTAEDTSLFQKDKMDLASPSTNNLQQAVEEASPCPDNSRLLASSRGSCSDPDFNDASVVSKAKQASRFREMTDLVNKFCANKDIVPAFRIDCHRNVQKSEEISLEIFMQRQRLESGGLLLCSTSLCRSYLC